MQALTAALASRGSPWTFTREYERAVFEADGDFDAYLLTAIKPNRRKGLARSRRRVEEKGKVTHESHTSGDRLRAAVEAFLSIEQRGWKGRRGTALACDEATLRFARAAFSGGAEDSICRADILTLDGTPIAVSLMVFSGQTGFAVKCTYDEEYAAYSPGLLLELEIIRSFLSTKFVARLDAATAGAHVIDELWPGRVKVADILFCPGPPNPVQLASVVKADSLRRSARAAVKRFVAPLFRD